MQARVAVLVPCFDDGAYVAEAVESIREEEPVEIVVVDDGSTDATTLKALDGLRDDGVQVIRHEQNRGASAARTTGRLATTAPYVFTLDADDLLMPGVLAALADELDAHPEAMACYGDLEVFGAAHFRRRMSPTIDPFQLAYRNVLPSSALYRRSMLDAVGAWQPVVPGATGRDDFFNDWNLWMSLAERGAVGVHLGRDRAVYRWRVHEGRLTNAGRARRRQQYLRLRERHPALFADLRRHRRRSDLPLLHKLLYPVVFGHRPRLPFEYQIKSLVLARRART